MAQTKLIAKTATRALKVLWSEGFFQDWRKASDIDESLSARHHHFSQAELGMALLRAKYLTRRGNRGDYAYIQKHPFTEDTENEE